MVDEHRSKPLNCEPRWAELTLRALKKLGFRLPNGFHFANGFGGGTQGFGGRSLRFADTARE